MKRIIITTVCLCIGAQLLTSMTDDKETLADLIAKNEKILVAVDRYSKIERYPVVGTAAESTEQMLGDIRDKLMRSLVESLNKGFNTEAFQYYRGELVDKKMMHGKGLQFFVIVTLKGRYTMNAEPESDYRYRYKFEMSLTQDFYQVNEKGKPKTISSKPSGMAASCEPVSTPSKTLMLKYMLSKLHPQCVEQKLLGKIEKRIRKFAEKELAKAAK